MKLSMSVKSVRAAAVCVAGVLFLASPYAGAQESESGTGNPPRPKVVNDGMFRIIDSVGYGIPYYFQEGKGYSDEDAHVYYAPSFKISAGPDPESIESRSIKYHFDEVNESLTLYFQRAVGPEEIEAALRKHLQNTAKEAQISILKEGLKPYRIAPLLPDHIIFSSVKEYLQGDGTRKQVSSKKVVGVTQQQGEFTVDFYGVTKSQADRFIADLQNNYTQIEYTYHFAGISDEICYAEFKNILDQDIDLFKDVAGEGGEGYVARHQVASIAERAVSRELYETRCSDTPTAQELLNGILKKAGQVTKLEINGSWKKLDNLVKLDADSFKADLIESLDTEEFETIRDIAEVLSTKSSSKAQSWGAGAGASIPIENIPVKVEAKFGRAKSEAKSKAIALFTDALQKTGLHVEFEGNKFIPKSVDVYSLADLRRELGKTVAIEVSKTSSAEGHGTMRLTESDWTVHVRRQNFAELRSQFNEFKEDISDRMDIMERRVRTEIKLLGKSYEIDIGSRVSRTVYLRTGINVNSSDGAYWATSIADWVVYNCKEEDIAHRLTHENLPRMGVDGPNDEWIVIVDGHAFSGCRNLRVNVIYWPSQLVGDLHYHRYSSGPPTGHTQAKGYDKDDE